MPASSALTLAASEQVYLQGEKFAKKAGVFNKIKLMHNEMDVSVAELVTSMYAAAFLSAEERGAIRLEVRQKKALLGLTKVTTLYAEPVRPVEFPAGSLEASLFGMASSFKANKERNEVNNLVYAWMRSDSHAPWQDAVKWILAGMAERGVLDEIQEKKLKIFAVSHYELPETTRQAATQLQSESLQHMFLRCQQQRPDVWGLLMKQIKSGVDSRQEQDNTSTD